MDKSQAQCLKEMERENTRFEAHGGRSDAGQGDLEGDAVKKVVGLARRLAAVEQAQSVLGITERSSRTAHWVTGPQRPRQYSLRLPPRVSL